MTGMEEPRGKVFDTAGPEKSSTERGAQMLGLVTVDKRTYEM